MILIHEVYYYIHQLPNVINQWRKRYSRTWFRSTDLWVMSPARFHCATLLVVRSSFQYFEQSRTICGCKSWIFHWKDPILIILIGALEDSIGEKWHFKFWYKYKLIIPFGFSFALYINSSLYPVSSLILSHPYENMTGLSQ